MDDDVFIIPTSQTQPAASHRDGLYRAFASNLKRNPEFGRHLGSFQLYLPDFDLHVSCAWLRDQRGNEHVGMPRVRVTAPDGKVPLQTAYALGHRLERRAVSDRCARGPASIDRQSREASCLLRLLLRRTTRGDLGRGHKTARVGERRRLPLGPATSSSSPAPAEARNS